MKRVVKASSADYAKAKSDADKILKAAKNLLDIMDATDEDFIQQNDLGDLYDCLIEDIPALQVAIRSNNLFY